MFTKLISWKSLAAAALVLLVSLALSCSNDSTGPETTTDITAMAGWGPDPVISGELVSCTLADDVPVTETTVEWEYDGNGTLDLRHISAACNYNPELSCEISVVDRIITVVESDAGQTACLCLADVDYQITGLPPGKYLLRFEEVAPIGDDDPLECEILLKGCGVSGTCVVDRTQYPWQRVKPTAYWDGYLVGGPFLYPECEAHFSWEYIGSQQRLNLTHYQLYWTCCAETVDLDLSIDWNAVTITEDADFPQFCPGIPACVLTNYVVIYNLPECQYSVTVNRARGLDPVTFTIDLASEPVGELCIEL